MSRTSQMEIFVEVARRQGFTAAAEQLNVSKSHVSKQIERLEEHLGVRLLHRTTREVSLTEVGEIYFRRCEQILSDIRDAERAVSQVHSSPTGTLRVAVPMTFGLMYLESLFDEFLLAHPGLNTEIHYSDELVGLLDANVDAAVRIADLDDSSLIGRQLAPVKMVTVASPDYLAEHGEPKKPEDLRDHSCLRYSYQISGTSWRYRGPDGDEVSVQVDGRVTANNGRGLTQAACAGLGIYLAPDFIVADPVRQGELEPVLTNWEGEELTLWVVYPDRRFLARKVRLFVDFLADEFSSRPPWALDAA